MHGGDGLLSCRVAGGEICFTRMHANGVLRLDELEIAVNGTAWMEREFGNFPLKHDIHGWDWFAIQFENGTELRLYHLRGHSRLASDHSSLAFIDEAGAVTWLGAGECSLQSKALWTSARTGIEYPTQWLIEAPGLRCSLCVSASLCCNELDTRGSSNVIYWEGPAIVSGQLQGSAVSGRSFVELVGYDVSQRPSGVFDFTTNRLGLWDSVFNEFRQHLHGPGVSISED